MINFVFLTTAPNKQLMLLQFDDEDLPTKPNPDPPNSITSTEFPNTTEHHLSLNAMKGASVLA
jgi:hypothetical protein